MRFGNFNRRTAGRFVLLGWAVALAWLARRELGKTEAEIISEATIRLSPEAAFYSVLARGQQVGYASVTVDTVPGGFTLSEVLALDVANQDSVRRVTRRTELFLSRSLRLRTFTRTITGAGLFEELSGSVDGDSLLHFAQRNSRAGERAEWRVRLPGDVVLPQVLPYRLAFSKRLEVGRSVRANVLDLNTGVIEPVDFLATAESTFVVPDSAIEQRGTSQWIPATYDTLKAWRIEHLAAGTPIVTWVDAHGGMVHSEAALGVRMERSAFEVVTFNYRTSLNRAAADHHHTVPAMRTLAATGIRPPRDTTTAWTVSGTPIERFLLPRLAWLDGGRQRSDRDRLEVGSGGGVASPGRTDYLGPPPAGRSPFRQLAAGVVEGTREPMDRVAGLLDWVHREVGLDTAVAAATAPTLVLAGRGGSADGLARLFVEMARSVGLTARPVSGVAVLDEGVYGHAWAEVLLDGHWLAVDPAFGHSPASSYLVRLTIGGTGRAIDLVPLIGSASFAPRRAGLTTLGARR